MMEITHHKSKMSSEQEEHGVPAKRPCNKDCPLGTDTEDGIPMSKFKEHERKKPPGGQMQGQEEVGQEIVNGQEIVDGQPEQQDTRSPYDYFKHFHVIKPSGRHEYELGSRPSEVMSPFMEQILKDMPTGSSTHAENETLRIFRDIVTSPKSVTAAIQILSVTYVFIHVESSSTDESFTVTPKPCPKNVLALIYDARNKRFVLVLQGKIEESIKWKNEILKTVFDMMLLLYRKVNTQANTEPSTGACPTEGAVQLVPAEPEQRGADHPDETCAGVLPADGRVQHGCGLSSPSRGHDVPCHSQNCSQTLKTLSSDAFDAELRDSTVRRNISEGADKYKQNKSPPVQAMEKMSITKGEQQQQQPQQEEEHEQQTPQPTGVQLIPSGSKQRQQLTESVEVDLIQNGGSEQRQQLKEPVEVPLGQNRGEPDKPPKDTGISGKFQNSKIISDK